MNEPLTNPAVDISRYQTLQSALRDRIDGWLWYRDQTRDQWTEPGTGRQITVDEVPGQQRVIEGWNGVERVLLRVTAGTDPATVINVLRIMKVLG